MLTAVTAEAIHRFFRTSSCTSLTSLTLALELSGTAWTVQKQWELNLAVLEDVPAHCLQRIQLCVIFDEDEAICDDTVERIKNVRWLSLRGMLDRFANLREVALVTRVTDDWLGDQIWQEFELVFRPLRRSGNLCIIRRPFCIV